MTVLEPEYEQALVEAAVLVAVTGRAEERPFRRERDRLYEIADVEARDTGFATLHARWFERLALERPLRDALAEQPVVVAGCGRCVVARAVVPPDEAAELFVAPPARPTLLIRLCPETISTPDPARELLRHELFHVADMLDPRFGYAPRLGGAKVGPPGDRLLRDRYRALWDAFIDGRLTRLGRAPATVRARRLCDFRQAFPDLGDATEMEFERFFGGQDCRHADLVAFATGGRGGNR